MAKEMMMISVDVGMKEQLKSLFPGKVSTKINDFLHSLVAYKQNDLLDINKRKMEHDIDEVTRKITSLAIKKDYLVGQLEKIKDQEKIKEAERLEQEKEQANKLVTCLICNIPKPNDRMITFKGGIVCKSCFLDSANKDKVKQLHLGAKK